MITCRFKVSLACILLAASFSGCDDKPAAETAHQSRDEKELYDEIAAEHQRPKPTVAPSYSAADFIEADKRAQRVRSSPDESRQLQDDLRQQQVDRRLNALEQDAALRAAEADAQRAKERVEAVKRGDWESSQ